jgi:hypothetical protein
MLHGDELIVSECPGIGAPITTEEAEGIARGLLERRIAEDLDDEALCIQLEKSRVPAGVRAVIDSEGLKVLHG